MSAQPPPSTAEEGLLLPSLPALDPDDIDRPADALLLAGARRAASTYTGKEGCSIAEHLSACMEALCKQARSLGGSSSGSSSSPMEAGAPVATPMPHAHTPSCVPHELFITNVPRGVTQLELRPLMEQFGPVLRVNTRRARGFVTFASRAALDACLRAARGMSGIVVNGVKLQVRDNSETATHRKRLSGSKQPPPRRRDHREQDRESGAPAQRRVPMVPPGDYVCHLCDIPGHFIKDCPFVATNREASRDRPAHHGHADGKSKDDDDDAGATATETTTTNNSSNSSNGARSVAGGHHFGKGDTANSDPQMTNRQRKRARYQEILTKHKREEVQQQADDAALRKLQSETPCRFWALGRCKAGLDCPFLHAAGAQKNLDVVCEHFLSSRGCDRGDACVFQHPKGVKYTAMRRVSHVEAAAAAAAAAATGPGAFAAPAQMVQRADPRPRESVVQVIRVRHASQPGHGGHHAAQSSSSRVDDGHSSTTSNLPFGSVQAQAQATSATGAAPAFPTSAAAGSTPSVGRLSGKHGLTTAAVPAIVQQSHTFVQEPSIKPPTHDLLQSALKEGGGGAVPLPPSAGDIARNEDLEDDSASEGADFGSVFDDFED